MGHCKIARSVDIQKVVFRWLKQNSNFNASWKENFEFGRIQLERESKNGSFSNDGQFINIRVRSNIMAPMSTLKNFFNSSDVI